MKVDKKRYWGIWKCRNEDMQEQDIEIQEQNIDMQEQNVEMQA